MAPARICIRRHLTRETHNDTNSAQNGFRTGLSYRQTPAVEATKNVQSH